MTEEVKTVTPAGDTTPVVPDKAGQVDLDSAAAKYRRESEAGIAKADKKTATEKARADKAEAKLTEIDEAKKTEQEKAVDTARTEGKAESDTFWNKKVSDMAIDHALTDDLRARGYDPDFAMLVRSGGEIDSAESASGAVGEWLKTKGWPEKVEAGTVPVVAPGGGPKGPKLGDGPLDAAWVAKATPEEINKNWDKFKEQNPSGRLR